MERIIFDLDGTLLRAHWDEEKEFFRKRLGSNEKTEEFIKDLGNILNGYESRYSHYDIFKFNKYINDKGYNSTAEFILDWIRFSGNNISNDICPGAVELLELCKENDIKMSVATNWFTEAQTERLRRTGLLPYFDTVIGGDYILKPGKGSFYLASHGTPYEDCLVIGDKYNIDYIGAINAGMKAIYLANNTTLEEVLNNPKHKNKILVKKK